RCGCSPFGPAAQSPPPARPGGVESADASAPQRAVVRPRSPRRRGQPRPAAAAGSGRIGLFLSRALLLRGQKLDADLILDLAGDIPVRLQIQAGVVLALADAITLVRVPGPGLLDDPLHAAQLEDLSLAGDAGAVHDLELGLPERRGDLVLDHL